MFFIITVAIIIVIIPAISLHICFFLSRSLPSSLFAYKLMYHLYQNVVFYLFFKSDQF